MRWGCCVRMLGLNVSGMVGRIGLLSGRVSIWLDWPGAACVHLCARQRVRLAGQVPRAAIKRKQESMC